MSVAIETLRLAQDELRRTRIENVLVKLDVAGTFLDRAAVTGDSGIRLRNLRNARDIVEAVESFLDTCALSPAELTKIRAAVIAVRSRITLAPSTFGKAAAAEVAVAVSLARGAMVYHFAPPGRGPLFAGDLFRIALRLRFARRIL